MLSFGRPVHTGGSGGVYSGSLCQAGAVFGFHASTVRLDSVSAVVVTAALAVLLVALVPWRWDAWRRRRTGRSVTVLLAVAAVGLGCGVTVNRLGGFYPTLGSLIGSSPNPGEGTVTDIGPDGTGLGAALPVLAARSADGHGSTVHLTLHGDRSGLTRDADVYLRSAWALSGWSSVGYCAMNLALRHPDMYSVAVSQSGHDRTPDDLVIGDLFGGRADLSAANDVGALLRDHPAPLTILATAGADESDEQAALGRLRADATPPVQLDIRTFPGGGHNQGAVRAQLPALVDWWGRHLPGPLADPAPLGPGVVVQGPPGIPPRALPDPGAPAPGQG